VLAGTLALALLASCGRDSEEESVAAPPAPVSIQETVTASPLEPSLSESLGEWKRSGAPRTWSAASLDLYIGPDAERWRRYGLLDTVTGSYERADGSIAIVELYRFRAASDAFGAYSTRRGFDARVVSVGNEGFATAHSLVAWKGPVVVRIVGKSPDRAALEKLGVIVAASLAEGSAKPSGLAFLAGLPIVSGTEIWTEEEGLGYAMFRGSALARIQAGDAVLELLRHADQSDREAQTLFEEFRNSVTLSAKTIDPVLGVGNEAFFAQDTHLANTLAFRAGSDVVVLRGQASPETFIRIAEAIASRLRATVPAGVASKPVSVP
jgi:hypothetical protein